MRLKKHQILFMVFFMEVWWLAGCGSKSYIDESVEFELKQAEVSSEETESLSLGAIGELGIQEDMLAYWMVLNNKKPFVSIAEDGQRFYWNEYFWRFQNVCTEYHADYFIIVDMDGDGANEIVVDCSPESVQLLHYEDGIVYDYQFAFRGMKRIHNNGIYEGSDGAASTFYLRLTELNKDGYKEETIAVMDGSYYEVEGKETAYGEFCDYVEPIESAALADCMEFTESMLDQKLLGNLTDQEIALVKQISKENMLEDEPDYQEHKRALQLYRAALSGEEDIIYVIMDTFPGDYDPLRVYFSIVDMDGDGVDELVFTRESGMIEILHYEDGQVYGYQFRPLKLNTAVITTDGVFQTEDLSSTGYARITSFEKDGCKIESVEDYESGSYDRVRYYFYSEEAIAGWLE